MIFLRYVGKKERETDHLYGTNLMWIGHGDIKPVADGQVAAKMLVHTDVWELASEAEYNALGGVPAGLAQQLAAREGKVIEPSLHREKDDESDRQIDQINLPNMKKADLIEYAHKQHGVVLDPAMKFNDIRKRVVEMRQRAGIRGESST